MPGSLKNAINLWNIWKLGIVYTPYWTEKGKSISKSKTVHIKIFKDEVSIKRTEIKEDIPKKESIKTTHLKNDVLTSFSLNKKENIVTITVCRINAFIVNSTL